MLISAIMTKDELALVLESLLPLSVALGPEQRDRSVTFDHAELELVRGRGARLRGSARAVFDIAGVTVPIAVQRWQILLQPRIAEGPNVLTCEPLLEALEVERCPSMFEGRVRSAVGGAIAKAQDRLSWGFGRTLSRRLPLPQRVRPGKALQFSVVGGACAVSDRELAMRVELKARAEPNEPRMGVVSRVHA
jgi:hypothetical protein